MQCKRQKGPPSKADIDAIAIDLDGTVVNSSLDALTKRTTAVFKRCIASGVRVIVCTGRSSSSAEPFRAAIGAEGPMVCSNGSQILDMPSGDVLELHQLSLDAALFCEEIAKNHGIYFQIFFINAKTREEFIVTSEMRPEREVYRYRTGMEIRVYPLTEAIAAAKAGNLYCIKGLFLLEENNLGAIPVLKAELERKHGSDVTIVRSWPTFLEILPAGMSKGAGLLRALHYSNLTPERTAAFGDEENDIPLLLAAGWAGAPENARDSVKEAADFIVGPCNEDGVAIFLEEIGF